MYPGQPAVPSLGVVARTNLETIGAGRGWWRVGGVGVGRGASAGREGGGEGKEESKEGGGREKRDRQAGDRGREIV